MKAVIEEVSDSDPTRNDDAFRRMLNESQDNVEDFLRSVFSFLKRNTSYMARDGSDKAIAKVARQFQPSHRGVKSGFLASTSKPALKPKQSTAPTSPPIPEPATTPPSVPAPEPEAGSGPGTFETTPDAIAAAEELVSKADDADGADGADGEDEGTGLRPNAGNGLDLETYSWVQTLADVVLSVPVPAGTRGRDCDVQISTTALRVGLKGAERPVLDGALCKAIVEDECFWNCDGATIEVTLQKKDAMTWWTNIVQGEPEVNTQKVQPENSKLSDLDGETRQTVEKMMFDQRQKAAGKPTSEEAKQQEMLSKFMAAHPEMDFSNAKVM